MQATQPHLRGAFRTSIPQVKHKFGVALGLLLENDSYLVTHRANERSITHKLAEYLQPEFPHWNVDCEYDIDGWELKRLEGIQECDERRRTSQVLPDIIVHVRGSRMNLLVVEVKTNPNADESCDIKKLRLFTLHSGDYRYRLGVFLRLNPDGAEPDLHWFIDGHD